MLDGEGSRAGWGKVRLGPASRSQRQILLTEMPRSSATCSALKRRSDTVLASSVPSLPLREKKARPIASFDGRDGPQMDNAGLNNQWSGRELNPRPLHCERSASQLSYRPGEAVQYRSVREFRILRGAGLGVQLRGEKGTVHACLAQVLLSVQCSSWGRWKALRRGGSKRVWGWFAPAWNTPAF